MSTLHKLPLSAESIPSPAQFTYPFCYEPHPLCVAAAEEIKPLCRKFLKKENGGKMFGVLVVEQNGERYYLAAFSGLLAGSYLQEGFVPPVYNLQNPGGYFKQEEAEITAINHRIQQGEDTLNLRTERKQRSIALQQWLFMQFNFLNGTGNSRNLIDIFQNQPPILTAEEYFNRKGAVQGAKVPSGAGECCAPKLLQYAYLHGLRPLCMAEFWLGPSPKDELRTDGNYYPACHAKCKPILSHMLQGLDVEENPMLKRNQAMAALVEYVYEDDDIAVVNKPSGLLATPGKDNVLSLLDIVRKRHPEAINAHRLDMDTSGLMLFALNDAAYKHLQQQFYQQSVKKEYVALLDSTPSPSLPHQGTISLPLLPNPFDRPRQMVSHEHGKRAVTHYILLEEGQRVLFHPQTGRTHQLRVHAAHPEGLGCPIKGDPLYGTPADRLYLHAQSIEFVHPKSGERVRFNKKSDF
ncbi:MAG: RluA family pseudouridine synthase [Bacteroidaceae bacterium]|nr:RluA family pseudouridine synthase [Bacteroidaceae bacterium]